MPHWFPKLACACQVRVSPPVDYSIRIGIPPRRCLCGSRRRENRRNRKDGEKSKPCREKQEECDPGTANESERIGGGIRVGIYEELHVPRVINAAGPVTRYGGSCLSDRVLQAMEEATRSYVRLDELQLGVGKRLASWTGAEAGYVTTGAAAGLALGAAAIMAGLDVDRMERLPDTEGIPNEFVIQSCHRCNYDHAIRAAGAKLVTVDCAEDAEQEDVRAAISSVKTRRICGTVYIFRTGDRGVPLETWVAASEDMNLPVLVDAAVRLPPVRNLRDIPGTGADLVVFSGGKAIGGPQGTGFVVGRRDLIESILLQNQDMDVNAETWFLCKWIDEGKLAKPSRNGIGRGYKVSKENIIGLLVALEEYLERDHAADMVRWHRRIDSIVQGLSGIGACHVEKISDPDYSYPVPMACFRLTEAAEMTLVDFVNACAALEPPVLFEEGPLKKGYLIIHPMCLSEEDVGVLVDSVRGVLQR
ncbi:MAG: aminotransferase class V-fold PLP-dependent enzyme [bacterium]